MIGYFHPNIYGWVEISTLHFNEKLSVAEENVLPQFCTHREATCLKQNKTANLLFKGRAIGLCECGFIRKIQPSLSLSKTF